MIDVIVTAFQAVAPLCLLIGLGYWLKTTGVLSDSFVATGNKLVFQLFLPMLVFRNVYNLENLRELPWGLVAYCVAALLILFGIGVLIAPLITKDPRRKGVMIQAVYRSNNAIVGLSLAEILGGAPAASVASVVSAFGVPMLNILGVLALSLYVNEDGKKNDWGKILKNIAKNPLIDGIALAFVCIAIRSAERAVFGAEVFTIRKNLPFVYTAISQLANVTSPFSLMILGGQFTFSAVSGLKKEIISGVTMRLILCPLVTLGGAIILSRMGILNCGPVEMPALIALFATPVAVASAAMATQMGSDGQLAAQLVVWSSLLSLPSMFLVIAVLLSMGLLSM